MFGNDKEGNSIGSVLGIKQQTEYYLLIADLSGLMRDDLEQIINQVGGEDIPSKSILRQFDGWQQDVLERIGQVINRKEMGQKIKEATKSHNEAESIRDTRPARRNDYTDYTFEFPPVPTPLVEGISPKVSKMLLYSTILLLLSLEDYSSQSRTLAKRLASSLDLDTGELSLQETEIAKSLLKATDVIDLDKLTAEHAQRFAMSRKWKIGLAAAGGAILLGVTGGLAAPLLAAGLGSVLGGLGLGATAAATYLGVLATSSAAVGALFGAYGGRMMGQSMERYTREVKNFKMIDLSVSGSLNVVITISGWLGKSGIEDVTNPWRIFGPYAGDVFSLEWEVDCLIELGNALKTMAKDYSISYVKGEIIKRTVFGALAAAMWPASLLKISSIIDNPWNIAYTKAIKAGEVLAEALIARVQGKRPVTLIGYSLGSRVILTCLERLAKLGYYQIVESAILMGTPSSANPKEWMKAKTVVAGRLINIYSENDYILAFLFRTQSLTWGVAGLQQVSLQAAAKNEQLEQKKKQGATKEEVETLAAHLKDSHLNDENENENKNKNNDDDDDEQNDPGLPAGFSKPNSIGIENINVGHLVKGHMDYRLHIGKILRDYVHMGDVSKDFVAQEQEYVAKHSN